MSKLIIHALSSMLLRPNGIVRYINSVMELQRSQGHYVILVTDANPSQAMSASQVAYDSNVSYYKPNMKDGHVWLQVDSGVVNQIQEAAQRYAGADLVIAHDLHSYLALSRNYKDGIFVQHESDVVNADSRFSYVDDEYLAQQLEIVNTTDWRVGMLAESTHIIPKRPVYASVPFIPAHQGKTHSRDLLYIGDSSDRKGAKEFMEMARLLEVTPAVITHDHNRELFAGANVYTFELSRKDVMYSLMREHKVAYLPSKNECFSLAVLECLQFMPVVVDGQYSWTNNLEVTGAHVATGDDIEKSIRHYLDTDEVYDRSKLETWCNNATQLWTNLST